MIQWTSAVPLVSWAPSRQGGRRVTWGPLREQVARSWANSWVRAWLRPNGERYTLTCIVLALNLYLFMAFKLRAT